MEEIGVVKFGMDCFLECYKLEFRGGGGMTLERHEITGRSALHAYIYMSCRRSLLQMLCTYVRIHRFEPARSPGYLSDRPRRSVFPYSSGHAVSDSWLIFLLCGFLLSFSKRAGKSATLIVCIRMYWLCCTCLVQPSFNRTQNHLQRSCKI